MRICPLAHLLPVAACLLLSACSPARTLAQKSNGDPNWRATPVYGTITLRGGFTPDPTTASVQAGGSSRNPIQGSGCTGYLSLSAPDVDLNYTAGSLPLSISAASGSDISLLVYTPDGRWLCDDDGADAPLDPKLTISNPRSGNYNIWVATYAETSDRPRATVAFSEVGREAGTSSSSSSSSSSASGNLPNWQANPTYGEIRLDVGFRPDPMVRDVTVGGSSRNPVSGTGCTGFINMNAPDFEVNYTAGSGALPLNFYVKSKVDTSLLIYTADGRWVCDDDSNGLNPLVSITNPRTGSYQIWVGAYAESGNLAGSQLLVSELTPQW